MRKDEDRFVARWLSGKQLSSESQRVLGLGKEVYKIFFRNLHNVSTKRLKINTWDAGWYQIRMCLRDHNLGSEEKERLSNAMLHLRMKILPQIEALGFQDRDETYE
jgi:hypothetical protein